MKLLALLLVASSVLSIGVWDNPGYQEHDKTSFFKRDDVNQPIDPKNIDLELLQAAVFYASNEVRAKKRKAEFKFDPKLLDAAKLHCNNMLKYKFFDHIYRKERKLRTPMQRIRSVGGQFNSSAENLARVNILRLGKSGQFYKLEDGTLVDRKQKPLVTYTYAELARDTVDKWMHSKGHRKNLMGNYDFLGVGTSAVSISKQGIPEIYITQNFGSR